MTKPQLRQWIFTDRPATFSSEIWYLALQLGQRNFIRVSALLGHPGSARSAARCRLVLRHHRYRRLIKCSLMDFRVASSGANDNDRSHISAALLRKPAF